MLHDLYFSQDMYVPTMDDDPVDVVVSNIGRSRDTHWSESQFLFMKETKQVIVCFCFYRVPKWTQLLCSKCMFLLHCLILLFYFCLLYSVEDLL